MCPFNSSFLPAWVCSLLFRYESSSFLAFTDSNCFDYSFLLKVSLLMQLEYNIKRRGYFFWGWVVMATGKKAPWRHPDLMHEPLQLALSLFQTEILELICISHVCKSFFNHGNMPARQRGHSTSSLLVCITKSRNGTRAKSLYHFCILR